MTIYFIMRSDNDKREDSLRIFEVSHHVVDRIVGEKRYD